MESASGARSAFMATLPAQIIRVEKPQRSSTCETIEEESSWTRVENWPGDTVSEVAPAAVITVKKQAFQSSLDTIWEDTKHYMAEYFVSEAAEAILRPVLRFNYSFESFPTTSASTGLESRQFFTRNLVLS